VKKIALFSALLGAAVAGLEIILAIADSLQGMPAWLDALLFFAWPSQLFLAGGLPAGGSVLPRYLASIGANALLYLCVGCTCAVVYRLVRRLFMKSPATI
jgi:hypothetical protein